MFDFLTIKKNTEYYIDEGANAVINNDYSKALFFYNKAIKKAGDDDILLHSCYALRSIVYKYLGDYKQAFDDINKAIKLNYGIYSYYFERAEIKELLNDTDGAEDDRKLFFDVLKENQNNELVCAHLNEIYERLEENIDISSFLEQKYEKNSGAALKILTCVSAFPNKYNIILRERIELNCKVENYINAINDVNYLLKLTPDDVNLYDLKTDILTKAQKYQEAVNTVNKAIKKEPENPHYHLMRGGIYIKLNKYKEASVDITKALSSDILNEDDKNACEYYKKEIESNLSGV